MTFGGRQVPSSKVDGAVVWASAPVRAPSPEATLVYWSIIFCITCQPVSVQSLHDGP